MKNVINKKRLKISIYIVLGIMLIGGLYYLAIINHLFSIPCFFHDITGYYCPGCGITRVFISLIQLDIYQAFRYNPLVFTMIPFGIVYGVISYKNWLYERDNTRINDKICYLLVILTLLFGILRNIDMFSYLAPTII